jgi:hypothetical protein
MKMMRKANQLYLIPLSLCLIIVLSAPLVNSVMASSGDFSLGSSTMSDEIWSSSAPKHVTVTVTVTGAMADAYADTTLSSVTVTTDNQEVALHNGESQTIEDASTDSVWLYENAGYDHNYYAYYGIRGNWEVTVIGGGDGGDGNTLGTEDTTNWAIWGIVAAVIIGLAAAVVILLIKRKPSTGNTPQS